MARDAGLTSVEDLRRFENSLGRYKEDLVQSTNAMIQAVNTINESWSDKVQEEFMQRFADAMKGVQNMAQLVDEHRQNVHKSADILDQYLASRR